MGGGLGGPLRLLASALGGTAALVVLQTLAFRVIPYDAARLAALAAAFHAAFIVMDVSALMALAVLGRRAPSAHPFTTLGVVMIGVSLASAIAGWLVSSFGGTGSAAFGGIEPMLSFGATFLMAFALVAVLPATAAPDGRRSVALGGAIMVVMLRVGLSLGRGPTNMLLTWLRFALTIVPPASLGALAFLVARSKEVAGASGDATAAAALVAGAGGYRGAGEGSATAPRPELAPPDPATIEPLRIAASGISLQRTGFITRVAITGGAAFTAILPLGGLAFLAYTLAGGATAVAIIAGLMRQRELASFRGGGSRIGAVVAFACSGLADLALVLFVVSDIVGHTHHFGRDAFLLLPFAPFFAGIGIILASRAHERAGDLLCQERLASLARWTQGVVVVTASLLLASFAALSRSHDGRFDQLFGIGFVLLTLASLIAVVVFHIKTLSEANRVLKERLALASTSGAS